MPPIGQIWVEYTHALCFDTPYKAIECGKNIVKLDDQLPFGHYTQAHNYGRIHMYDKAAEEYEAALNIYYKWKTKPVWSAN